MRSIRSEVLSAAVVLSMPVGIILSFPLGVLGFRAEENAWSPARTAFVSLTPEAEQLALRAVHASWREKAGEVRRMKADLFCAELPDDGRMSVLSLRERSRLPPPPPALCERTPFLPSQKAPPPSPIATRDEPDPPVFSRHELLKMN